MNLTELTARLAVLEAASARECAATTEMIALSKEVCHMVRESRETDVITIERTRHLLAESWALLASVNASLVRQ